MGNLQMNGPGYITEKGMKWSVCKLKINLKPDTLLNKTHNLLNNYISDNKLD